MSGRQTELGGINKIPNSIDEIRDFVCLETTVQFNDFHRQTGQKKLLIARLSLGGIDGFVCAVVVRLDAGKRKAVHSRRGHFRLQSRF